MKEELGHIDHSSISLRFQNHLNQIKELLALIFDIIVRNPCLQPDDLCNYLKCGLKMCKERIEIPEVDKIIEKTSTVKR